MKPRLCKFSIFLNGSRMKPRICKFSFFLNLPRMTHTLSGNRTFFETQKRRTAMYRNKLGRTSLLSDEVVLNAPDPFDEIPDLDAVSATKIIGRLAREGLYMKAVHLFSRMLFLGVIPSEFTFGTVIPFSIAVRDLQLGRQFHACAMKMGLHSIVFVGSAVLDVYSKLGSIDEAQRALEDIQQPNIVSYTALLHGLLKKQKTEEALQLFRKMPERNVVSWNAMIAGCSQTGCNEEAVNLFIAMQREGFVPSPATFPCVFTAVSNMAAIGMGRSLHACAIKSLGNLDVFVGNALVSFYAKCGSMDESLLIFDQLPERTVVSWNAVICGFAQNGKGENAVNFFERMRDAGLRPNGVTMLGLLWACTHAGLVDKGYSYFNQARTDNPSILRPEHYACMVDLLSRCGCFKEAKGFLHNLPFNPGIGFWKTLLGGCQIHWNIELIELAARKILALDPEDVSTYIMLSNAYSAAERWHNVSMIRREMNEKGLKRVPGCSWIEIRRKVDVFVNNITSHYQNGEIYSILNFMYWHLRETKDLHILSDNKT